MTSTETWKTVYDSGSLMEEILKAYYANIFNSEAEDGGAKPQVLDEWCLMSALFVRVLCS